MGICQDFSFRCYIIFHCFLPHFEGLAAPSQQGNPRATAPCSFSFPLRWSIAPGWIFEAGRPSDAREPVKKEYFDDIDEELRWFFLRRENSPS